MYAFLFCVSSSALCATFHHKACGRRKAGRMRTVAFFRGMLAGGVGGCGRRRAPSDTGGRRRVPRAAAGCFRGCHVPSRAARCCHVPSSAARRRQPPRTSGRAYFLRPNSPFLAGFSSAASVAGASASADSAPSASAFFAAFSAAAFACVLGLRLAFLPEPFLRGLR